MNDDKYESFNYRFVFGNGEERTFSIQLEAESLKLIDDETIDKPEWAKSDTFSCKVPACLNEGGEYCPIGLILNRFIKLFSNIPSYEKVIVQVESNKRMYSKETSLQEAFGSLLGIMMPTSGCPTLGKLKPMVKYHLPFATIDETEFRVFSMYLLAQFIRMKNGKEPDWQMNGLKELYEDISVINRTIARKIADLEKMDASINSVIVLNNFADSVSFSLEDNLQQFEQLFDCWLKD